MFIFRKKSRPDPDLSFVLKIILIQDIKLLLKDSFDRNILISNSKNKVKGWFQTIQSPQCQGMPGCGSQVHEWAEQKGL